MNGVRHRGIAFLIVTAMTVSCYSPVYAKEEIVKSDSQLYLEEEQIIQDWQGEVANGDRCYITETGEKLTGFQKIEGEY